MSEARRAWPGQGRCQPHTHWLRGVADVTTCFPPKDAPAPVVLCPAWLGTDGPGGRGLLTRVPRFAHPLSGHGRTHPVQPLSRLGERKRVD